jgi:hypothetical protein
MCAAHGAPERFCKSGFAGAPRETDAARPALRAPRATPERGPTGCVSRHAARRRRYAAPQTIARAISDPQPTTGWAHSQEIPRTRN